MPRSLSLYEVLGVKASASTSEIRTAYRVAAKAVHPDRADGVDPLFRLVQEAYEVLSDPSRRQRYDAKLGRGGHPGPTPPPGPPPPAPPKPPAAPPPRATPSTQSMAKQPQAAESASESAQEQAGGPGRPVVGSTAVLVALWVLLSAFLVFEFATIGRGAAVIAVAYVAAAAVALWTVRGPIDLLVRASWVLTAAWLLIAGISWAMGRSILVAGLIGAALAGWAVATTMLAARPREAS